MILTLLAQMVRTESVLDGWNVDWPLVLVLLQVLTVGYLGWSLHKLARNQVALGDCLKRLLEKDD
jgi:uncharacterized integral membrane protein